jgi:hypothetical protein
MPREATMTNKTTTTTMLAVALLAGLAGGRAQAATIIVTQKGEQPSSTFIADGDHLRMERPGERESVIIMDVPGKRLVMVRDGEKSYSELTEADMKQIGAQLAAARAQMDERMKNMTPEQRKQVEQAMGSMAGMMQNLKKFEWKFDSLGQKKTVNGMPCEMYKVSLNGEPHEEDCILPWSSRLLKRSDFTGLENFTRTMTESIGARGAGDHGGVPLFHEFPGLPISRVPLEGGTRGPEEQVKSIKQGSPPAGAFTVPTGYTKKPLPMGMGGMGKGMAGGMKQ